MEDLLKQIVLANLLIYTWIVVYTVFIWYITVWILNLFNPLRRSVQKVSIEETHENTNEVITELTAGQKINRAINPFS